MAAFGFNDSETYKATQKLRQYMNLSKTHYAHYLGIGHVSLP